MIQTSSTLQSTQRLFDKGFTNRQELESAELQAQRKSTDLILKINRYIQFANANPRPFAWTKSADEIFETIYAMCKDTSGSEH